MCQTWSDTPKTGFLSSRLKNTHRNSFLFESWVVTDRSKAILLWWFFLFYVLVFKFFCAVGALCVFSNDSDLD